MLIAKQIVRLWIFLSWTLVLIVPVQAQQMTVEKELEQSQTRLEAVRERRRQLQQDLQILDQEIENVSERLVNIEQQISTSRSILDETRFQVQTLSNQINNNQKELFRTKDQISLRSAELHRRLRQIYKRGPLHTLRILLGSESFPDLLTKYRYLYLASYRDRSMLREVRTLEENIVDRANRIEEEFSRLSVLQYSRLNEVINLDDIEQVYRETLLDFRSEQETAVGEMDGLTADENRISSLIESLELQREELARRTAINAEEETFDSSSIGPMDWPVRGPIIYNFGRDTRPNGNVLRWNGIGIQAEVGSPVRAAKSGTVVLAGPFEGYGPTVVLSHGEGFYTLYLYLEDIWVTEGHSILQGEVLGSVGGLGTPQGPHVEFQVRVPIQEGRPQAQDPRKWLQPE